jgi:hypothetical protein
MAAMIEQVQHKRLTVVFEISHTRGGNFIGESEDALGDAKIGLVYKPGATKGVQDNKRVAIDLHSIAAGSSPNIGL